MAKRYKAPLNIENVKRFLNETGLALAAYSIFLTALFQIIDASYFEKAKSEYMIFIFLMYGLIFILGFFILEISQKYKESSIQGFGLVVFVSPILFWMTLNKEVKEGMSSGGFVIMGLIFFFVGIWCVDFIVTKIQKRWKTKGFYFFTMATSILFFILIKYTLILSPIYKFSVENFNDWLTKGISLGIEFGITVGLICIPALKLLNKLLPPQRRIKKSM